MKPQKKYSKDWEIGFLIGELIVERYLPSLKGLECETNNSVPVSYEDRKRYNELENSWFELRQTERNSGEYISSNEQWIKYREFAISLYQKYFPEVLECYIPIPDDVNVNDVKTGIRVALWDSDRCMYNISTNDDIIIENEEPLNLFSVIRLNLDIEGHKKDLYDTYKKK